MKRKISASLAFFSFLCSSVSILYADTWSDGFESGNFTQWDITTLGSPTISTTSKSGTYGAQLSGGPQNTKTLHKNFDGTVSSATVSAYVNITDWATGSSEISFDFSTPGNNATALKGAFWIWAPDGGYSFSADNQVGYSGRFNAQLTMNEWN